MRLTTREALASLPHDLLARVAREHMLWGHLIDRALMPELIIAADLSAMEAVAIDEWMGASPAYTRRMRRLMGIEGDSVAAIMKALQLDVGFVHEYMDVGYSVADHDHGEFWLNHCGALLDVEPMGEAQVVSMCHHIEDPTFDATALATNPHVRIRPIHRPPRAEARPPRTEARPPRTEARPPRAEAEVAHGPACHWTVVIDATNPPVDPAPITERVAALPLARAPLESVTRTGDGLDDYRGGFLPEFRLELLSSGALRSVMREFALQAHLVAAAGAIAIEQRHGAEVARTVSAAQAVGVSWVGAQRLARVLDVDRSLLGVAEVMAIHPLWPTGISATIEGDEAGLEVAIEAEPGLLDPDTPGWLGLLAGGDTSAVAACAHSLDPQVIVETASIDPRRAELTLRIEPDVDPAPTPRTVDLLHLSSAADWQFAPP